MLPSICPLKFLNGVINDPSVYMHCCGWYLRGFGGSIYLVVLLGGQVLIGGALFLGVFFHVFENLMRCCVVVGLMG